MANSKRKALYLNSSSDWKVLDENGKEVSLEEAETRWKAGRVADYNVAFERLARNNFDMVATKGFYGRVK